MIDTTVRQARRSTALVAALTGLLAAWQLYRHHSTAAMVLAGAAAVLCCVLLNATLTKAFYRQWMRLAEVLGAINSRIVLSALFLVIVAPVGFVMRRVGYDVLDRRGTRSRSYWHMRTRKRQAAHEFEQSY